VIGAKDRGWSRQLVITGYVASLAGWWGSCLW